MPNKSRDKKIIEISLAFNSGLVALIFSTQFFPIEHNLGYALLLFAFGFVGIITAFILWSKIP